MAIQFDGDNLVITLESAVTEVDIVDDLYRDWKDYMLLDPLNRRFPQALLSDGGAPLTATLDQGAYIFLNNTAGWRIKAPEEDITITLIGNLIFLDIDIPGIIPTTGDFTVAYLGLQPITQRTARIPGLVWEEATADHTTTGTFGKFVKSQILTVGKFLGLK